MMRVFPAMIRVLFVLGSAAAMMGGECEIDIDDDDDFGDIFDKPIIESRAADTDVAPTIALFQA